MARRKWAEDDTTKHRGRHHDPFKIGAEAIIEKIPNRKFFRTRDVMKIIGVHEITVYRWVANGWITAHRRGNKPGHLFKRDDLIKFVKSRCAVAPTN